MAGLTYRQIRKLASPFKQLVIPRRIHVYVVGAARSGTKSLARIFQTSYRAAHEPGALALIEVLLRVADGSMTAGQLRRHVRARDRRLWLEIESSQLAAELLSVIMPVYPEAKIILTIRDPRSWLESIVNHEMREKENRVWSKWANLVFRGHLQHPPEERELLRRELFTVEGYLSHWRHHNERVLDAVPADRLLIVRTDEISFSLKRIADFVGIPAETLDRAEAHANIGVGGVSLRSLIDEAYLDEKIREVCGPIVKEAFPDFGSERGRTDRTTTDSQPA